MLLRASDLQEAAAAAAAAGIHRWHTRVNITLFWCVMCSFSLGAHLLICLCCCNGFACCEVALLTCSKQPTPLQTVVHTCVKNAHTQTPAMPALAAAMASHVALLRLLDYRPPPPIQKIQPRMHPDHTHHSPTTPALAAAMASWLGMPCCDTAELQNAMEPPPDFIIALTAGRSMLKQLYRLVFMTYGSSSSSSCFLTRLPDLAREFVLSIHSPLLCHPVKPATSSVTGCVC